MYRGINLRSVTVGVVVAAGVLLAACGGGNPQAPGPIASTEGLVGSYHGGREGDAWIHFGDDGTYEIAFGGSADVLDNPDIHGSFRFEDGMLFMVDTSNDLSSECDNIEGSYEMTRLSEGQIQFNLIEDECTPRRRDLRGAADGWTPVE
jgi:hypothetical protein